MTLATFDYDALGRRSRLTRGNGTVTDYRYDPASRLSELVNDAAGADRDLTLGFGYNPASQIISNTRSNELYSYLGLETGSRATPVDGLNRPTSIAGTPIGHDGRGNIASIGADAFGYTAENRLVRARGLHQYYDALGRLAHVQASGTDFLYDGANVIEEAGSPGGGTRRRFVHGPGIDEPLVWYEGAGTGDRRWLHADERGSIVAVSNAAGAVTAINRYDEYGAPQEGNSGRFRIVSVDLPDYESREQSRCSRKAVMGGREWVLHRTRRPWLGSACLLTTVSCLPIAEDRFEVDPGHSVVRTAVLSLCGHTKLLSRRGRLFVGTQRIDCEGSGSIRVEHDEGTAECLIDYIAPGLEPVRWKFALRDGRCINLTFAAS